MMRSACGNPCDFVFPGLAEGQWKQTHERTLKLAKSRTKQHFFARAEHPTFEIAKPEMPFGVMIDNRPHGIREIVERHSGQVETSCRFGNRVAIDVQH